MSDGAPVSSVSECSATQSSDSSNGSFAFYIHSQDTLNHGPPLHEDRKAFARQKRRRTRYGFSPIVTALRVSLVVTINPPWYGLIQKSAEATISYQLRAYNADPPRIDSPEDHAILEAEYQLNPKPDKAARMHIVERVALGEKEVQVSGFGQISDHSLFFLPLSLPRWDASDGGMGN